MSYRLWRLALSAPVAATALVLSGLLAGLFVVGAGADIARIPPGPTAWHDAPLGPFAAVATGLPLLAFYLGSLLNWWRGRERPSPLVIIIAVLNLFLVVPALGSTR